VLPGGKVWNWTPIQNIKIKKRHVYALPQKLGQYTKKNTVLMAGQDSCCWPHKSVNTCLKVDRVNVVKRNMKVKTLNSRL
jgi:hypothetical protein